MLTEIYTIYIYGSNKVSLICLNVVSEDTWTPINAVFSGLHRYHNFTINTLLAQELLAGFSSSYCVTLLFQQDCPANIQWVSLGGGEDDLGRQLTLDGGDDHVYFFD